MLKYLFIAISLIIAQNSHAQQKTVSPDSVSGFVVYRQKINMRNEVLKNDTLKFNRSKSIFYWNLYNPPQYAINKIKKKYPNVNVVRTKRGVPTGQINLYDTAKDSLYSRKSMRQLGHDYYLKEKNTELNWQITDSSKKIGNYMVKKAQVYFRGRHYTTWFAPAIPLPYGPWKLNGLPGLILQAYDDSGNIHFSTVRIKFKPLSNIGPIVLNGYEQVITLNEYKDIMNHFDKRMKANTLKKVRGVLSKKQIKNMPPIQSPDIRLMEIFNDSTGQ